MDKITKNVFDLNKNYKYKFSVIIPVFNVEDYIEETILSVVNQTIGFEENIQLILVNDGSKDKSAIICKKYQKRYKNNIIYVEKENGGVSSARNEGMKHIEGRFVNFLDSDDKWELDAFEKVYQYFCEFDNEVDVVSCRIKRFDAKNTFHSTDFKYQKGNRVVNLTEQEDEFCVQLSASNVFFKEQAVKQFEFDVNVKLGEDSLFVNAVILEKLKYGIMSNVIYYYRIRQSATSAVQTQTFNKSFYCETVQKYHLGLAEYCKQKYGEILPYIQNVIAYDIGWRLFDDSYKNVLTENEANEYLSNLKQAYNNIEDRIILKHPVHSSIHKKTAALKIKYGIENPFEHIKYITTDEPETTGLFFKDTKVYSNFTNFINRFEIVGKKIIIEGLIIKWLFDNKHLDVSVKFKYGSSWIEPEFKDYPVKVVQTTNGPQIHQKMYRVEIPVGLKNVTHKRLKSYIFFGQEQKLMTMAYSEFISSATTFEKSKLFFKDISVVLDKKFIQLERATSFEEEYIAHENDVQNWLFENELDSVANTRKDYWNFRNSNKIDNSKIWLFSDSVDKNNCSKLLFIYTCLYKPKNVLPVFVINNNKQRLLRAFLSIFGKVISFEDNCYPLYFLHSDKIISTNSGEFIINPFEENKIYFNDLMKFKYFYIENDNSSKSLNRFNKNFDKYFNCSDEVFNEIVDKNTELLINKITKPEFMVEQKHFEKVLDFKSLFNKKERQAVLKTIIKEK